VKSWRVWSWIIWGAWVVFGVVWELYAVWREKRDGTLPLTRIVRDKLMRKSIFARLGVLLFLGWLSLHFLVGGPTPVPW
jgi:hypothetical protein